MNIRFCDSEQEFKEQLNRIRLRESTEEDFLVRMDSVKKEPAVLAVERADVGVQAFESRQFERFQDEKLEKLFGGSSKKVRIFCKRTQPTIQTQQTQQTQKTEHDLEPCSKLDTVKMRRLKLAEDDKQPLDDFLRE